MTHAQSNLVNHTQHQDGPVECLGMTFPNDDARRGHFLSILREKLQDPEFRKIEGFPIGTDEEILALSDPPYYTACPNPFIAEFTASHGKAYDSNEPYSKGPFTANVSEGKNDPIYNAHSYHTKVPHKAIMRYILHYTKPGDIVFDGFCGTGMAGVAAQLCANPEQEFKAKIEHEWKESDLGKPEWGIRRAILGDLSPAATFIAYNYNNSVDTHSFIHHAKSILAQMENNCDWMYETVNGNGQKAIINYTVWSDVFLCPNCGHDVVFFDRAIDKASGRVRDAFSCANCEMLLEKHKLERKKRIAIDAGGNFVNKAVQHPVLINFSSSVGREMKTPFPEDVELINKVEQSALPYFVPLTRIDRDIDIWYERDYRSLGVSSISDFYTHRSLISISTLFHLIANVQTTRVRLALKFAFTGIIQIASRMSSFRFDARNPNNTAGGILKGALYIPSISKEARVAELFERKIRQLSAFMGNLDKEKACITTQSISGLSTIPDNSIDYIFLDPPFGSNIIYSDLSLPWEAWLSVSTNTDAETVIHGESETMQGQ